MTDWQVITGDCLDVVPALPAGSVDAIITDIPYGTTACSWDSVIPFAPMWAAVKHVLKPRGVFVTTASQPFTSALVMSNPMWFRYGWVWQKSKATGFLDARKKPLKQHEDICVFSQNGHGYNPQMTTGKVHTRNPRGGKKTEIYGNFDKSPSKSDEFFPKTVLHFKNAYYTDGPQQNPTQKPVALYEYLIKTYTNPGELVLDITAGSGTTGVAAINTGRRFIGIELREDYADIARERIAKAAEQARQLELI